MSHPASPTASTDLPSPPDAPWPSDARRIAWLGIAWMFLYGALGTGLVGPNRPGIERELGLSHAQFGAAFAVIQIACSFSVLAVTSRARRLDRSRALSLSLLAQTVGFVLVFIGPGRAGLAAGWSLITLGATLGFVSNSLSAKLWPDNPRRGVLLLHGFDGAGKVTGPALAALCLGLGWRWSFAVGGALTGALLIVSWRIRLPSRAAVKPAPERQSPETTSTGSSEGDAPSPETAPPVSDLSQDAAASPGPSTRSLLREGVLPFALLTGANVSFATLVPTYSRTVLGLGASAASLALSAHLLGMAVGRFGLFSAKTPPPPNRVIALCIAAGLAVFPLAGRPSLIVALVALFGVGLMFSGVWPTYYGLVSPRYRAAPHRLDYGSALGGNLGAAACVWISSALAERSLFASLAFGPAMMALFGVLHFAGVLRSGRPEVG